MADIAGFPYFRFEVDKEGNLVDKKAPARLVSALAQGDDATDVFLFSHGWNNDMTEAQDLYETFFNTLRPVLDSGRHGLSQRKFAVVGIFWPSKKFAESDLISGGVASTAPRDANASTRRLLDELKNDGFDHPDASSLIEDAKDLLPKLETDALARKKFADIIRKLPNVQHPDRADVPREFFTMPGDQLMDLLAAPMPDVMAGGASGGAAVMDPTGGSAALGEWLSGVGNAALRLLNYTTYYQMKERAGKIGRGVVADLLRDLSKRRLHLIGHSFGARLVTAAALGPDGRRPPPIATMTLLQGAFSHNGFALNYDGHQHDGFFRKVVSEERISGPLLITHSIQDKAVGKAYAVASRLAGQAASWIGDANDPYGGIGGNGAQHTPEAVSKKLSAALGGNDFTPGVPHNLNGDKLINGHSDIDRHPEIASALLWAVSKT